jgi:hypothetical protein
LILIITALVLLAAAQATPEAAADTIYPGYNPELTKQVVLPLIYKDTYCFVCSLDDWEACKCAWCIPEKVYCRAMRPAEHSNDSMEGWLIETAEYQNQMSIIPAAQQ